MSDRERRRVSMAPNSLFPMPTPKSDGRMDDACLRTTAYLSVFLLLRIRQGTSSELETKNR